MLHFGARFSRNFFAALLHVAGWVQPTMSRSCMHDRHIHRLLFVCCRSVSRFMISSISPTVLILWVFDRHFPDFELVMCRRGSIAPLWNQRTGSLGNVHRKFCGLKRSLFYENGDTGLNFLLGSDVVSYQLFWEMHKHLTCYIQRTTTLGCQVTMINVIFHVDGVLLQALVSRRWTPDEIETPYLS